MMSSSAMQASRRVWIASSHVPARDGRTGLHVCARTRRPGICGPGCDRCRRRAPESRVITVSGDGGFSYAIGELATHALHGLRTVNIVLNNGTLAWLAIWQRLFFEAPQAIRRPRGRGARSELCAGRHRPGLRGNPSRATGRPRRLAGRSLAATRPVVVDVRTDPMATPIHSYRGRLAEGKSYPRPGTVYQLPPPWRRSHRPPTRGLST